ncbi:hypothetical protein F2Q70_00026251 [Brassica cretica]|uniref:Uncharacterized protein n=1 Tax=Brassica cretica TaxID=69181 RepID=A0A8S9L6K9_BRACR|nr:hypothetical protein F2Q68_00025802 [Brassica cretica]KAF2601567.1 hypothetical protein F2Q70_00026251 [Brassica cretica]
MLCMFGQVFVGRCINGGSERSAGASILEVALKFEHRTSIEPVMEMLGPSLWDVWNTSRQACSGEPVFFQQKHSESSILVVRFYYGLSNQMCSPNVINAWLVLD